MLLKNQCHPDAYINNINRYPINWKTKLENEHLHVERVIVKDKMLHLKPLEELMVQNYQPPFCIMCSGIFTLFMKALYAWKNYVC